MSAKFYYTVVKYIFKINRSQLTRLQKTTRFLPSQYVEYVTLGHTTNAAFGKGSL